MPRRFQYYDDPERRRSAAQRKVDDGQQVTPLYLPLKDCCHMQMLRKFVEISVDTDTVDIFRTDVGITAFHYVWQNYAWQSHLTQMVTYGVFVCVVTAAVLNYNTDSQLLFSELASQLTLQVV